MECTLIDPIFDTKVNKQLEEELVVKSSGFSLEIDSNEVTAFRAEVKNKLYNFMESKIDKLKGIHYNVMGRMTLPVAINDINNLPQFQREYIIYKWTSISQASMARGVHLILIFQLLDELQRKYANDIVFYQSKLSPESFLTLNLEWNCQDRKNSINTVFNSNNSLFQFIQSLFGSEANIALQKELLMIEEIKSLLEENLSAITTILKEINSFDSIKGKGSASDRAVFNKKVFKSNEERVIELIRKLLDN